MPLLHKYVEQYAHNNLGDIPQNIKTHTVDTFDLCHYGWNIAFFLIEMSTGIISRSMGLVADSLDMLADALVYGMSLMAVGAVVARKKRSNLLRWWYRLV